MINITFLLGNGFDKNMNLKTLYSEFYSSLDLEKIYKNSIYRAIFYLLIPKKTSLDNTDWQILNVFTDEKGLFEVTEIPKQSGEGNYIRYFKPTSECTCTIQDLKNVVEKGGIKIQSYYELWADLEKGLGIYTKFINEDGLDQFLDDYTDMHNHLKTYLANQMNRINCEDMVKSEETMYFSIVKFFEELPAELRNYLNNILHSTEPKNYDFLLFNYTDIFDRLLNLFVDKEISKETNIAKGVSYNNYYNKPIHIHGTLEESMLIGVNDKSQILNSDLQSNEDIIETLVKPECNDRLLNGNNRKCSDIIESSNIICLYGLSIGETDAKWWKTILDTLMVDTANSKRVIIFAYNPTIDISNSRSVLNAQRKVRNKLLSYAGDSYKSDESKMDTLKQKIIIKFNSNKFRFRYKEELNEIAITKESNE